ncbi:hypothetical protein ACFVH0_16825 [Streptomyces sp. NPDC127117]|uniref:hypothetical protein n=1 Tax=Streptomyces sp. NPDC127117 TaxID=3345368 RepID=UPI00362587F6
MRHLLVLAIGRNGPEHDQEASTPAADVAFATDRLLTSDPSDLERATAELLNHAAVAWDKQDHPLRKHAQAVARSLPTRCKGITACPHPRQPGARTVR